MSVLVGNPEDRFSRVAAHLAVHRFHYSGACVCVVVFVFQSKYCIQSRAHA